MLRADNGGEYTSNEFLEYCSLEGINEHTVPHTPQQNGVAERKNMKMVGAAKAMLFDHGLPLFLWAEAYQTAGRKTPEEVFTSTRPDVSHLCVFGSVCYCHIHADTRKKLDPFGEKGLLVDYKETSKAYMVYILTRKRIIVSKDVQFDEDKALRRSMDLPALESWVKLEEPQVQVQTHDTGSGSQRELGG